jgi:hypothetical protein
MRLADTVLDLLSRNLCHVFNAISLISAVRADATTGRNSFEPQHDGGGIHMLRPR